jgi:hypothetical protein
MADRNLSIALFAYEMLCLIEINSYSPFIVMF